MKKSWFCLAVALLMMIMGACFAEGAEKQAQLTQTEGIVIPVFNEENMKKFEIPDNEAMRFIRNLRAGWNLGNTFDAYDDGNPGLGLRLESWWCGTKTNRELIHKLKETGFNLIRIPVSWHNHLVDENYTVDPAWMARVKEVAGWCYEEGLYFIINVHHDNSEKYFYPDSTHYQQSERYLTAIWKQIAENFAEFDEHCILESMNEPRLVGTEYEWYLNEAAPKAQDAVDCINRLNQVFVDLVRASGGNNAQRYLSVPGYCASPEGAATIRFKLPEDTAENKIIVEVHAYRPYNFALNTQSKDSSFDLEKDAQKKADIATFMNSLYNKFVKYGTPVLIDEFGALNKTATDLQARVNLAAYYTASASARGITCCWWDNHNFSGGGERFGLISRSNAEWKYPDIALAIMENCKCNR